MGDLARTLSEITAHPLVDKTGHAEKFNVNLEFAHDDVTAGLPRTPSAESHTSPFDSRRPATAAWVKVNSAKGPVEVMVIDSLGRLSEN